MSHVAVIILAAGRGTRFGQEPKLLAMLSGKSLVRHAAEAAAGSSAEPIIVVTGHRAEEIEASLADLPVRIVRNPAFAEGLSTSLKAGFAALPADAKGAVVMLGDMPLVTADLIDALVSAWRNEGEPVALVPTLDGQRGNPVVISRTLEGVIAELSGDVGAGPSLRRQAGVLEWPVTDAAILQDVDTTEAIGTLQSQRLP